MIIIGSLPVSATKIIVFNGRLVKEKIGSLVQASPPPGNFAETTK
jgi:hypothetical protein